MVWRSYGEDSGKRGSKQKATGRGTERGDLGFGLHGKTYKDPNPESLT
jgi:hypothetical protein